MDATLMSATLSARSTRFGDFWRIGGGRETMSRSVAAPPSSRRPIALAWLERLGGEQRYVERETRIGRGAGNDIRLDHPTISRDHALIRRLDGGYVISDLGSTNGTFVNGQRVYAPRPLSGGDRV